MSWLKKTPQDWLKLEKKELTHILKLLDSLPNVRDIGDEINQLRNGVKAMQSKPSQNLANAIAARANKAHDQLEMVAHALEIVAKEADEIKEINPHTGGGDGAENGPAFIEYEVKDITGIQIFPRRVKIRQGEVKQIPVGDDSIKIRYAKGHITIFTPKTIVMRIDQGGFFAHVEEGRPHHIDTITEILVYYLGSINCGIKRVK